MQLHKNYISKPPKIPHFIFRWAAKFCRSKRKLAAQQPGAAIFLTNRQRLAYRYTPKAAVTRPIG